MLNVLKSYWEGQKNYFLYLFKYSLPAAVALYIAKRLLVLDPTIEDLFYSGGSRVIKVWIALGMVALLVDWVLITFSMLMDYAAGKALGLYFEEAQAGPFNIRNEEGSIRLSWKWPGIAKMFMINMMPHSHQPMSSRWLLLHNGLVPAIELLLAIICIGLLLSSSFIDFLNEDLNPWTRLSLVFFLATAPVYLLLSAAKSPLFNKVEVAEDASQLQLFVLLKNGLAARVEVFQFKMAMQQMRGLRPRDYPINEIEDLLKLDIGPHAWRNFMVRRFYYYIDRKREDRADDVILELLDKLGDDVQWYPGILAEAVWYYSNEMSDETATYYMELMEAIELPEMASIERAMAAYAVAMMESFDEAREHLAKARQLVSEMILKGDAAYETDLLNQIERKCNELEKTEAREG